MSEKDNQSLDILGLKPVGEAINTLTKGSVEGASAFLSKICLPAAEEFGLLLKDKVSNWRANNLIKLTQKAEKKLLESNNENAHAHPRIVEMTLQRGSLIDNEELQEMWSGLLVVRKLNFRAFGVPPSGGFFRRASLADAASTRNSKLFSNALKFNLRTISSP